jgi:membrane protein DedA with SNARE-associated domain
MNDSALLTSLGTVLLEHRYLILFAVAIFDGTWSVLAAGVLAATGFFDVRPAVAILIVSETIGGYLWYAIGRFGGARSLDWLLRKRPSAAAVLERVRARTERATGIVLFIVKVTYSVTVPVLILIGTLRYDLRKFSAINIAGSVIWASMVFGLGYLAGDRARAFVPVLKDVGHAVLLVLGAAAAVWTIHRVGSSYLRRRNGSTPSTGTG